MAIPHPIILRCLKSSFLQFRLSEDAAIVGRGPTCDFIVDDLSISRRHAELSAQEAGLQVTDLNSRNGTFHASARIATCVVPFGELIWFGDVGFYVDRLTADQQIETDQPQGFPPNVVTLQNQREASLSSSQRRVYFLLCEGLSEKAIASRLKRSQHTIHNHIRAIYAVFGVHSRTELMASLSTFTAKQQ